MKNHIFHTLGLTLFVLISLLILKHLPTIVIAGHTLRQVDILSDIRFTIEEEEDSTFILPPVVKPTFVDTCLTGLTCIEDYSDSTLRGMSHFYESLDHVSEKNVNIAVFGDSFIEADIFTADLREMLQNKYGGYGVGLVDITSATNGYRPTVRHNFGGWETHATTDTVSFERNKQGINGHYFIPRKGAYAEFSGQKKYASRLDTCSRATIFFYNKGELSLSARINKQQPINRNFTASTQLQKMEVNGRIGSIRWNVTRADSAIFFGAAMDDHHGIIVDNLSLRGSSGLSLRYIPEKTLRDFNTQRPYDLIILEYGLNVATPKGSNYEKYCKGMHETIAYLKMCFPQASLLIFSVGDRNYKTESGEIRTMSGIKNLIRYQQHLAADTGIAFWNLYEAMGGEGSMAKLVNAKPSMANYDYTHINFKGGNYLAKMFYETLVYGKERFDRKREYENGK